MVSPSGWRFKKQLPTKYLAHPPVGLHACAMFSAPQTQAFHEDGFVRLPGALDSAQVGAMRERIWRRLVANGAERDDATTWTLDKQTHLQKIRRADPLPSESPLIHEALEQVFGEGEWLPPKHWGQALVTFPSPEPWDLMPKIWHLDYPYRFPSDAILGANLFLFVSDVRHRGGGTLVVKSSQHLIRRFVQSVDGLATKKMKVLRKQFDARSKWFSELTDEKAPGKSDRILRFMEQDTDVDGVAVRVVELTGSAGDAVLCHPWLVHNGSPNTRDQPRMMRVCRVSHRSRGAY